MAAKKKLPDLPAAVRPIVVAARRAVLGAAPKGAEEIACAGAPPRSRSMMWKLLRFTVDGTMIV